MNHYDAALNDLIEHIKADKGIVQPWRNKAVARMEEAMAFIRMGLSTTNREAPSDNTETKDYYSSFVNTGPATTCNCPTGGIRRDCPVHGLTMSQCICTPSMPARKDCPVHGRKG